MIALLGSHGLARAGLVIRGDKDNCSMQIPDAPMSVHHKPIERHAVDATFGVAEAIDPLLVKGGFNVAPDTALQRCEGVGDGAHLRERSAVGDVEYCNKRRRLRHELHRPFWEIHDTNEAY